MVDSGTCWQRGVAKCVFGSKSWGGGVRAAGQTIGSIDKAVWSGNCVHIIGQGKKVGVEEVGGAAVVVGVVGRARAALCGSCKLSFLK